MSSGRSIASNANAAISAFGIPEFFMINKIATRLADGIPATPMLVNKAATTTMNCSNSPMSIPITCATNITATHS